MTKILLLKKLGIISFLAITNQYMNIVIFYVSVGTTWWGMNMHIRYHRRALRFTIGWILSWWELCLDSIVRKR